MYNCQAVNTYLCTSVSWLIGWEMYFLYWSTANQKKNLDISHSITDNGRFQVGKTKIKIADTLDFHYLFCHVKKLLCLLIFSYPLLKSSAIGFYLTAAKKSNLFLYLMIKKFLNKDYNARALKERSTHSTKDLLKVVIADIMAKTNKILLMQACNHFHCCIRAILILKLVLLNKLNE